MLILKLYERINPQCHVQTGKTQHTVHNLHHLVVFKFPNWFSELNGLLELKRKPCGNVIMFSKICGKGVINMTTVLMFALNT